MATNDQPPVLVYDGECGFCAYWVRYWKRLTGPNVRYEKFQEVAGDYPAVSRDEFARSIQLFERDGRRYSGAQAAFRVLDTAPQNYFWLWLYERVPGVAPAAEACYDFVARHRVAAAKVAPWLWGKERLPDEYALVSWVFLRLIALTYLIAFASLSVQITGLVGPDGLLPAADYLAQARKTLGASAYWQIPTIFWFGASDFALTGACVLGMALAIAVLLNRMVRAGLLLCYVLYLSLVYAGQTFLEFQWDMLLLESGFLALFLTFGSRIVIWLYRWLLFRFMFMGGVVKLWSGDPSWWNLNALKYHFETQPLPSPLAWYGHYLPDLWLRTATGAVFVIELVAPLLVFLPRNPRLVAATAFLLLQSVIMLTGNFNFFNVLTIFLCVFLLEDRDIRRRLPAQLVAAIVEQAPRPGRWAHAAAGGMAVVVLSTCGALLWLTNMNQRPIQPFDALVRLTATLGVVNGYGPFAIVTTERHEIIVEGSDDGRTWLAYEFNYKPGDPSKPLSWNIPHQPRLDWQMWFAALNRARAMPWLPNLLAKLADNSEAALSLLQQNPFPKHPPRYARASLYRYSFAEPQTRAATGQVWQREFLGVYLPERQGEG